MAKPTACEAMPMDGREYEPWGKQRRRVNVFRSLTLEIEAPAIADRLDRIVTVLGNLDLALQRLNMTIEQQGNQLMADFTQLNAQLTANTQALIDLRTAVVTETQQVADALAQLAAVQQQLADVLAQDMADQTNVDQATALAAQALTQTQEIQGMVMNILPDQPPQP